MSVPLTQVLEGSRKDVVDSLRSVPAHLAAAKPAPDRWSPLDCMEHLIVVEHRFMGWITHGEAIAADPSAEKEQRLTGLILDRTVKAQAPEPVQPTGKYHSIDDAIAAFNQARDLSVKVAQARGDELYTVGVKHPRFGEMNAAELVHLLAGHARRHAAQIRESIAAAQA